MNYKGYYEPIKKIVRMVIYVIFLGIAMIIVGTFLIFKGSEK